MRLVNQSIVEAILSGDLFKVLSAMQSAHKAAGVVDISQIRVEESVLSESERLALRGIEINPFLLSILKGHLSIVTYFCEDQKINICGNMKLLTSQQLLSVCLMLASNRDQS